MFQYNSAIGYFWFLDFYITFNTIKFPDGTIETDYEFNSDGFSGMLITPRREAELTIPYIEQVLSNMFHNSEVSMLEISEIMKIRNSLDLAIKMLIENITGVKNTINTEKTDIVDCKVGDEDVSVRLVLEKVSNDVHVLVERTPYADKIC